MNLTIDIASPMPVYEQIVHQVEQAVLALELAPGTPLPTIRQLAADLQINPNTVARAYGVLEDRQVIATAGRRGTFVHETGQSHARDHVYRRGTRGMSSLLEELTRSGLSADSIRAIFRSCLRDLESAPGSR